VLLFGVAERPDFIALDALRRNPAHRYVMEGGASQTGIH
jgi:hypothetical protein